MNIFEAKKILDLPEYFTPDDLKKNYRRLAMEYHPDKCKDPNKSSLFIKINEAYEFLNNPPDKFPVSDIDGLINNLFKSFKVPNMPHFTPFKVPKDIKISPKEYFTGTTRETKIPTGCSCERSICLNCAGCGFSNVLIMETCMDCVGEGSHKTCKCNLYQNINIIIQPYPDTSRIKIDDPRYTFLNNKLYYIFDITLKESLVGFNSKYIDPLGELHDIRIKNSIIKQNDGYIVKFSTYEITLLFNIIYPEGIKKSSKKLLEEIDF